jgi:hypothetical protein
VLINVMINPWVLYNIRDFLTDWAAVSLWRRSVLCAVVGRCWACGAFRNCMTPPSPHHRCDWVMTIIAFSPWIPAVLVQSGIWYKWLWGMRDSIKNQRVKYFSLLLLSIKVDIVFFNCLHATFRKHLVSSSLRVRQSMTCKDEIAKFVKVPPTQWHRITSQQTWIFRETPVRQEI